MFGLNSIYHPITALPGVHNNSYMELPPCPALTPYIRCFWGSAGPVRHCEIPGRPVIPDTCMDLIFYTNYSQNQYDGQFTALDEGTYQSEAVDSPDITSIFAIRFYGWSAVLFSDRSMKGSRNQAFCTDAFFGGLKKRAGAGSM